MKIQCLYYALDKWNEVGGYILFRKSTHWCMPHVLHLDNTTNVITHYVPPEDLKYPWYSMFGFEGYIKTGDSEKCVPMSAICMLFGSLALMLFGALWVVNRTTIRRNRRSKERERRSAGRVCGPDRRRLT